MKAPTGANLAVATSSTGDYMVLTNGKAFPTDFAARVTAVGAKLVYQHDGVGFALVSGLTSSAATQLRAISGVSSVDADAVTSIDSQVATASVDATDVGVAPSSVRGDGTNPALASRYSFQWNMRLIGADKAWAAGKLGSEDVTVAILDTGIDYDVPDLNGRVDLSRSTSFMDTYYRAPGETVSHLSDNALTAKFFPSRNPIEDYNGHGTNVANQVSSNAFAIAGVTSKTKLIGVKVLGSNGSGTTGTVLAGVLWAADHAADVANMSLGGGFSKSGAGQLVSLINRVFNYANRAGMLIVVAAGNAGTDLQHNGNIESTYCDSPHVICVSSVGVDNISSTVAVPAYYTNFGRGSVDIAAPGGGVAFDKDGNAVFSAWPWGTDAVSWVWSFCSKTSIAADANGLKVWRFDPKDSGDPSKHVPVLTSCFTRSLLTAYIGTSQASPHVAGLAASLVAEMGHGHPSQIKAAILKSAADDVNPLLGRGLLSVSNAFGL